MQIEFKSLNEISSQQIIRLHTNPLVLRNMPLANATFSQQHYQQWIKDKNSLWQAHGYGPWAFIIDGRFAGWGGLQSEEGEPDLALVLHPDFWGTGLALFNKIINQAFTEMNLPSITLHLPPSRIRSRALSRLKFQREGEVNINGQAFIRFRLNNDVLSPQAAVTTLDVEVAYALPKRQYLLKVSLADGSCIEDAIRQSGILERCQEIDLRHNKVGIYSRPAKLSDPVHNGDRVEIYRPLLIDPKEWRRQRAGQMKKQNADKTE